MKRVPLKSSIYYCEYYNSLLEVLLKLPYFRGVNCDNNLLTIVWRVAHVGMLWDALFKYVGIIPSASSASSALAGNKEVKMKLHG